MLLGVSPYDLSRDSSDALEAILEASEGMSFQGTEFIPEKIRREWLIFFMGVELPETATPWKPPPECSCVVTLRPDV